MPTLKLPNDLAKDLASITAPYCDFGTEFAADIMPYGIIEVVENRPTGDTKRWTSIQELVIKTKDGALWLAMYEEGLTENQWQSPFEYDGDEITFTQVRPIPVSVIRYQVVGD